MWPAVYSLTGRSVNLLGGITLLRNSVPKAVEVSSRLRRLRGSSVVALRCLRSLPLGAYPLMTILRLYATTADSSKVDCNEYPPVSASDYSCSVKSSMPVRLLRFDIFQRHLCYLYFCYSHVLTVNKYGHELNKLG